MKKTKMLTLIMISVISISFSQSREGNGGGHFSDWVGLHHLNHSKGVKLLSFRYGGTHFSNWKYFTGEFNYFIYDKIYLNFAAVYDGGLIGRTKYNDVTLNASASYTIFDLKDRFYVNTHAGLKGGLQFTYNEPYDISDIRFIYGGLFGAEVEYFIGKLALSAQFQEFYTRGTLFGNWHYSTTLGLKFIL